MLRAPQRFIFAILVLVALAPNLFGWGPAGHRIVARIAQAHLSHSARLQITQLLDNDDLAAISIWADEMKSRRPQTYGWHFVDIPINSAGFSQSRDCYRPDDRNSLAREDHHNCVVDRIEMFSQVLADRNAPRAERVEALKFLVHFVGDIHQPMHAVAEARGGNDVSVIEFGSTECGRFPCNLHFLWDVGLMEHSRRSESEYGALLENLIRVRKLRQLSSGSAPDWANESLHLTKQVWLNDGASVGEMYYQSNIHIVDERLALAGLRLAALLNKALGDTPTRTAPVRSHPKKVVEHKVNHYTGD